MEPCLDGKHKGLSKTVRVHFTRSVSMSYTPGPHHSGPFRTLPTGLAFVAMPLVYKDPVLLACTHTHSHAHIHTTHAHTHTHS